MDIKIKTLQEESIIKIALRRYARSLNLEITGELKNKSINEILDLITTIQ